MTDAEAEIKLDDYKQKINTDLELKLELEKDLIFHASTRRGYEIDYDAQGEWGCMPTESLLASIAACMAIDVVAILRKMRAEVSGFKIEAKAERNADPPQYIRAVHLMMRVKGKGLNENKIQRAVSLSKDKYCSVYHSLRRDLEQTVGYEIVDEE